MRDDFKWSKEELDQLAELIRLDAYLSLSILATLAVMLSPLFFWSK